MQSAILCLYHKIDTRRAALLECFMRMHLARINPLERRVLFSQFRYHKLFWVKDCTYFWKCLRMRITVLFLMRAWFVRPDKTRAWPLILRGMTRAYRAVQTRRALITIPLILIWMDFWLEIYYFRGGWGHSNMKWKAGIHYDTNMDPPDNYQTTYDSKPKLSSFILFHLMHLI